MDAQSIFALGVSAAGGYLMGSIPSGLILTRAAGLGDIRSIGSGNFGATNVLRTGSKPLAAATLAFDIVKAVIPILLASAIFMRTNTATVMAQPFAPTHAAALGAFLGHTFPVWLGFKGGKGVATYIGVLAALVWPVALIFCGCWLAMALLFRISSLSGITSAVVAPIAAILLGQTTTGLLLAIISLILIAKHHENIGRLVNGTEPRIGAAK